MEATVKTVRSIGFNKRSKFKTSQNHDDIIYKYARSSVKLAAFTLSVDQILDCTYEENNGELRDCPKIT